MPFVSDVFAPSSVIWALFDSFFFLLAARAYACELLLTSDDFMETDGSPLETCAKYVNSLAKRFPVVDSL